MGNNLSQILPKLFGKENMAVLMLGLSGSGKTTILYKMNIGEVVTTTLPGFSMEDVEYKNIKFVSWACDDNDNLIPIWKHYSIGAKGVVFVVDAYDKEKVPIASAQLDKILKMDQLTGIPLLVFANKKDLPGNLTTDGITDQLGLTRFKDRAYFVQSISARSGDGLLEGFEWLADNMK